MAKRKVELTILCEDIQQEVFARRFFVRRGFHPRKIDTYISPTGKGAGEQYVRKRYVEFVKEYRRKSSYRPAGLALAVVIDADTASIANRYQQLDKLLEENALAKRAADERIAIFVPKRNIETWIHYLLGEDVNEVQVYEKFREQGRGCKAAVEKLVTSICPSGVPEDAPQSLNQACYELQRIL